jgi:hypothetical protein
MRLAVVACAAVILASFVTGCGQGGQPSSGAGTSHTTASNQAQAEADAHSLLAMVRVPSGSTLTSAPHDTGFEQPQDFIGASASATASRTWIVHDSIDHLLRYVVAHLRPGSKLESTGSGGSPNTVDESQIRSWSPVAGELTGRWLQIQAYLYGTRTYLTARTQSQWVITRQASEQTPSNVTKITIRVTDGHGHAGHQLTMTKPRIVHQVVGLYNSLGVVQPVTINGCPPNAAGSVTLSFYDSPTNVIATGSSSTDATEHWPPSTAAWACFPIHISIAQQSYPSLSGNVITPLGKLLHTKLTP